MFCGGVVGAAALFTVTVNGLLIPPATPVADGGSPGLLNINPKARSTVLPCPTCAFALKQAGLESNADDYDYYNDDDDWIRLPAGFDGISLKFRVSNDGQRLELNGEPIYPLQFHRTSAFRRPIYVEPVSTSADSLPSLEITSSALRVDEEFQASDYGDVVVPITYQIMALDMQPMDALPAISIHLLKTSEGELLILKMDTDLDSRPSDIFPPPSEIGRLPGPTEQHSDCTLWTTFACQLKAIVEEKWAALRRPGSDKSPSECLDDFPTGYLPTHIRPPPFPIDDDDDEDMSFRYHHQPTHHYRPLPDGREHRHNVIQAIFRGVVGALIPILAGITVGLSVSFLGLAVGRLTGWLFSKLAARGSKRGYASLAFDADDFDEGKISSAEDEREGPPAYEHAPAYKEIE